MGAPIPEAEARQILARAHELLARGASPARAARAVGINELTLLRWREKWRNDKVAAQLSALEEEVARLREVVVRQAIEIDDLRGPGAVPERRPGRGPRS